MRTQGDWEMECGAGRTGKGGGVCTKLMAGYRSGCCSACLEIQSAASSCVVLVVL